MAPLADNAGPLPLLLEKRRTLVCVGAGGVGKTTVAAALGVAAARAGRRVLALTIDPARRLADSLGVSVDSSEPRRVVADELGLSEGAEGGLWVAVLDAKSTFDSLVTQHADAPALRDRILGNRLYVQLSSYLPGTQEYMAMERLFTAQSDPRFDLVVLDTPPTQNALDFFSAPDRMVDVLDGAAIRWLLDSLEPGKGLRLGFVARSIASALRGIASITGAGFLDQTAELLSDLHTLFGGFRDRAQRVRQLLRSSDLSCVLVTRPEPLAVRDARFLTDYLARSGIHLGAWIANRSEIGAGGIPDASEITAELQRRGLPFDQRCAAAVARAAHESSRVEQYQRSVLEAEARPVPLLRVPAFFHGMGELEAVDVVARVLAGAR